MVVDDDTLVRNTLVSQLEDQGYQIVEASDGLAAPALLDGNEPIDLLVTDFAMPGMNGLALIKRGTPPVARIAGAFADWLRGCWRAACH